MHSFCLLVNSSPVDSSSAYTAFRFAESIIKLQHKLNGIFFYQDGIHNTNQFANMPSDELNLQQKWAELSRQYAIPMQVCITAANRRGIISQQDAEDNDTTHFNLSFPFESAGLGELIQMMADSDRVVQF
ncbi:sulfurtransferase complex subunit TusD [Neptunicella sp. SCSIO 80796]|uniref:sulfurtransferase complex subunit TusD n=1 Tax=Neptunicella plasticusilytica TaxID=3117012 RepID=UPI003A4E55D3